MLVVTELFNIAINAFVAKKSTGHWLTELVASGTQCRRISRCSSCGNVMFHKLVSRILSTGGGGSYPSMQWGRHPPYPPPHDGIRSTSGRYASYWNAYLFSYPTTMLDHTYCLCTLNGVMVHLHCPAPTPRPIPWVKNAINPISLCIRIRFRMVQEGFPRPSKIFAMLMWMV